MTRFHGALSWLPAEDPVRQSSWFHRIVVPSTFEHHYATTSIARRRFKGLMFLSACTKLTVATIALNLTFVPAGNSSTSWGTHRDAD